MLALKGAGSNSDNSAAIRTPRDLLRETPP